MFEGKIFLPLTGMPILKRARSRQVLAVWLPEPLTVAATKQKLLTPAGLSPRSRTSAPRCTLVVLIESDCLSFPPREPRGYLGLSDLSVSGHLYAQPHRAPTHMWGGDASWK